MSHHRLFISYRRLDAVPADQLIAALDKASVEVWLDRQEIEDGASIQRRIDEGLAACHGLLAWYSKDYPASRACQWELTAALIAGSAETAPVKRLLVLNPEADASHIQPTQVRDLQHLAWTGDFAALAGTIADHLKSIQGTLGDLRHLNKPQWHGAHGLRSSLRRAQSPKGIAPHEFPR